MSARAVGRWRATDLTMLAVASLGKWMPAEVHLARRETAQG